MAMGSARLWAAAPHFNHVEGVNTMKLYKNIMEDLVEDTFHDMQPHIQCCTCPQCHADIIAYTLNQLPARYAVSPAGVSITKVTNLRSQHIADIQAALIRAVDVVNQHPRH